MWRRPLAASLTFLLLSVVPASADEVVRPPTEDIISQGGGTDNAMYNQVGPQEFQRAARMFTPLELMVILFGREEAYRSDPAAAPYTAELERREGEVRAAMRESLRPDPPRTQEAVAGVEELRRTIVIPVARAYLAASETAAREGGPLSPWERGVWDLFCQYFAPSAFGENRSPSVEPQDVRAFLRSITKNFAERPPAQPIRWRDALADTQRAVMSVIERGPDLATLYSMSGMTRAEGAPGPVGRSAALTAALDAVAPAAEYSELEREVLSRVLGEPSMRLIQLGALRIDLHRFARDGARLAMADQSDPAVQATLQARTCVAVPRTEPPGAPMRVRTSACFAPNGLAILRATINREQVKPFVCEGVAGELAPSAGPGGSATPVLDGLAADAAAVTAAVGARSDDAAAVAADFNSGRRVSLPGLGEFCGVSAPAGVASPAGAVRRDSPAGTRTTEFRPTQHAGSVGDVPGPGRNGQPVGNGAGSGGMDWDAIQKRGLPTALGAGMGLFVALTVGAGPVGIGAALLFGGLLGFFGSGKERASSEG